MDIGVGYLWAVSSGWIKDCLGMCMLQTVLEEKRCWCALRQKFIFDPEVTFASYEDGIRCLRPPYTRILVGRGPGNSDTVLVLN